MRMTTWNVPSTSRLARECEVPVAAMIQPFAELDAREEEVPVVDFGETGPPRCAKCRGYVNAWCKWVNGGSSWRCNLCEHETPGPFLLNLADWKDRVTHFSCHAVIPEYFCNIDANSLRLDHLQRPELNKGTVDFAVTSEYWATNPPPRLVPSFFSLEPIEAGPRPPKAMNYVFVIDVSMQSVQSGFLAATCQSIRTSLFGTEGEEACWNESCQLCIITFDRTLHFYNLSVSWNCGDPTLCTNAKHRISRDTLQCLYAQTSRRYSYPFETASSLILPSIGNVMTDVITLLLHDSQDSDRRSTTCTA